MTDEEFAGLVSASELADELGIGPSAISNWRRRHASFPVPIATATGERFRLAELQEWLASRVIPVSQRRPSESDGTTYSDRLSIAGGHGHQMTIGPSGDPGPLVKAWRAAVEALRHSCRPETAGLVSLALVWLRYREPALNLWRREGHRSPFSEVASYPLPINARESIDLLPRGTLPIGAEIEWRRALQVISTAPVPEQVPMLPVVDALLSAMTDLMSSTGDLVTPPSVGKLMVGLSPPSDGTSVLDQFCRAGELLLAVLRDRGPAGRARRLSGVAPTEESLRLSALFLSLAASDSGVEVDLVLDSSYPHPRTTERYDVLLANPPFNATRTVMDEGLVDEWRYGNPPSRNLNFAWLQSVVASLRESARAVVLTANGSTWSSNARERGIRERMVADRVVECVIALPDRLFVPYTGISTTLWVLRSPDKQHLHDQVLFVDGTGMGHVEKSGRRAFSDSDISTLVELLLQWRYDSLSFAPRPGFSGAHPVDGLLAGGGDLNPRTHVAPPMPSRKVFNPQSGDAWARALEQHGKRTSRSLAQVHEMLALVGGDAPPKSATERKLGDFCDVIIGPSSLTPQDLGTVPVVVPRNIRNGFVSDNVFVSVAPDVAETMHRYRLKVDDVVGVRSGDVGRFAVVRKEVRQALLGPGCLLLRVRRGEVMDPALLVDLLQTESMRDQINRRAYGSVQASLSASAVKGLVLPVPGLAEQQHWGPVLRALHGACIEYGSAARAVSQLAAELAESLMSDDGPSDGTRPGDARDLP